MARHLHAVTSTCDVKAGRLHVKSATTADGHPHQLCTSLSPFTPNASSFLAHESSCIYYSLAMSEKRNVCMRSVSIKAAWNTNTFACGNG